MAIHDVSYNDDSRSGAMPSVHDNQTNPMSSGTQGITTKRDDSSGAYVNTKDATVLVNDGDNDRILLGLLPDGTFGMVVSKEGVDVNDLFS